MDGATGEQALIDERVARVLKRPVRVDAYRVLGRGISGAATYRVTIDGTDAVLKLTAARSAPHVRERARREIAFYRQMAAHVPLRVPGVIGAHTDAEGFVLLLAAYEPAPPPETWQAERYLTAARQLARFHAVFWDRVGPLDACPWVLQPCREDALAEIECAHQYWWVLRERPQLEGILTVQQDRWIHRVVAGMGAVEAIIASLPLTLCHGDCNPSNVLVAPDGGLIWADWQEVRAARGPEDLSFLLQQATILGGRVPYDAVLATYQETLAMATEYNIPLALVRRVVAAAELRSRALHWPAYLGEAAPHDVAAMLYRIRDLVACLGIGV
jgi:Phosphotransferase enzyme family